MSGGGKGGKVTVGYKYHIGWHMVLCHGHLDSISGIYVDQREAWSGAATGGSIEVDAPELFGGDGREGGVSGTLDLLTGEQTQLPNSYLMGQLGSDIPAFRGVTSVVGRQVYMGNNPYLKPWAFLSQRVHKTTDGETQWYDEKAAIANPGSEGGCLGYSCSALYDFLVDNADSYWPLDEDPDTVTEAEDVLQGAHLQTVSPYSADPYVDADSDLDLCDGKLGWYVAPGDVAASFLNRASSAIIGLHTGTASYGGLAKGASTSLNTFLRVRQNWYAPGGGGQNASPQIHVLYPASATGDIKVAANETGSLFNTHSGVFPTDGKVHFLHVEVDWPDSIISDPDPGDSSQFALEMSYRLYVDGDEVASGVTEYSARGAAGDYVQTSSLWRFQFVYAMETAAFGSDLFFKAGSIDLDELQLALNRNKASYVPEDCGICSDMNPAHIVRECLTDPDWGLGYNDSDIDDIAFRSVADILYEEEMGISLAWSTEEPIEDFISEILRHVDGVLYVDRVSGKFVMGLVRDDYSLSDLLTLSEDDNIVRIEGARRPTLAELTSSVTVNYHDYLTDKTAGVTEHNEALVQIQNSITHTAIPYLGFSHYALAARVCQRDVRQLSLPLLSCTVYANRDAEDLNVGDPFILDAPSEGVDSVVVRVQQIKFGDGASNEVEIEVLEDVFATPGADEVTSPPASGLWVDPANIQALPSDPRVVVESPYYQVVSEIGQTAADSLLSNDPDAGFLLVSGGRAAAETSADGYVNSGSGYERAFTLDFSPYAYLVDSIGATDTVAYLAGGKDIDLVEVGSIAQIDQELVRVDSITDDSNGHVMTMGRGCLDTVPVAHEVDSDSVAVMFWSFSPETDNVEYTASDEVDVKLRTISGASTLSLAEAEQDTVVFNSRSVRPYPPGNLTVNGVSYPDPETSDAEYYDGATMLAWAHRDRLQQTSGEIYDYTEGDIGPEDGTTYLVEAYSTLIGGGESEVWLSVNVGSASDWEQDSNTDSDIGIPPEDSLWVHFRVTSLRGGYACWQSPVVSLVYEPDSSQDGGGADFYSYLSFEDGDVTDGNGDTTWSLVGGANIKSTLSPKFGTYHYEGPVNSALLSTDMPDIGTGDFRLLCWYRAPNQATFSFVCDFRSNGASSSSTAFAVYHGNNDDKLNFYTGGANRITSTDASRDNNYNYLEITRVSGVTYMFINGVGQGTYSDSNDYQIGDVGFAWGSVTDSSPAGNPSCYGYLDNCVLEHVAGHTSDYTPPTSPYPDVDD